MGLFEKISAPLAPTAPISAPIDNPKTDTPTPKTVLPSFAESVVKNEARNGGLNRNVAWSVVKQGEVIQTDANIPQPEFQAMVHIFINDTRDLAKQLGDGQSVYGYTKEQWLDSRDTIIPPGKLSITDQILQGIDGTDPNATKEKSSNLWSVLTQFVDRPILIPIFIFLAYAAFIVTKKSLDKAGSSAGIGSVGTTIANQTGKNIVAGAKLIKTIAKKV
jgi:hypothetical protein